eukprot:scaffold31328_cov57-Phaeocystis_antarctica.AAC.1
MFFMRPSYISVAASEEHGTSFDCFFTFPLPPRQRSPRVSHPAERAAERADGAQALARNTTRALHSAVHDQRNGAIGGLGGDDMVPRAIVEEGRRADREARLVQRSAAGTAAWHGAFRRWLAAVLVASGPAEREITLAQAEAVRATRSWPAPRGKADAAQPAVPALLDLPKAHLVALAAVAALEVIGIHGALARSSLERERD